MHVTARSTDRLSSEALARSWRPSEWSPGRAAATAVLVLVACYVGAANVAAPLYEEFGTDVLFPSYAILTAALLLAPFRWWWLLLVGAGVGDLLSHDNFGRFASFILISEVAAAASAAAAAAGVRLWSGRPDDFGSSRSMATFMVFTALVGPVVAASIGATDVMLHVPTASFWSVWRAWLLANAFTGLTVLPLILMLAARGVVWRRRIDRWRLVEATLLVVGFGAVGFHVLTQRSAPAPSIGPFEVVPFLLWATVRFGPVGTIGALSGMSALSIFGVSLGTGSFALPTPDESLLRLRVYVITHAVPLLLLAAVSRERERAAAALRGSQARYQSVVEDQTELIARVRADGTYTFVNGQFCRYFQSSPETLIGDTFWQFAPVERRADVRAMMASLTPEHPVTTWSGTVLAPGGEPRWHDWTVRAFFDDEGRLLEFQGVGRDITSQKQVEEERRKLEEAVRAESIRHAGEGRFRSLADNAPVLIWMSGLQNEGIHFNKTWLDFTGRTLDQELGFGWVDSLHPDDRQRCQQICDEAFRRREPLAMQFRLRRHDGEYRWVLDNGIASYGLDGIFNGYVGTCVDITDQKLAQESLETAARNKDEFLAMLGHELRNPLAPMAAAVEVLRMSTPADESIAWAQDVLTRQLRQMTRLVDDLLDVSRVSRGTIRLNLEPLDMDRVVLEAIETSRPLLTERGHTLSIDLASQPMQLWGDSVRLVQVISNLLNNAANYTDPGGHIAVSVKRIGDSAELSVADNGIGIPEEMLERVFMMFTQAPGSNERSGGGLGIGLTLVDHLIGLHGGTVEARSGGLGQGSEFVVRLPVALDLLAAGADAQAEVGGFETPAEVGAAMPTGHPGARKRVLVVDDNADAAEGMARLLRALEHEVRVANDGMTALSAAEDFHPDVVLLDIGMPSMSGLEVARLIKENSGGKGPLLVATTGLGRGEDVRRSEAAGFDHHLIKPIDLERLTSVLYG